jgi:hypothetical protein
MVMVGKKILLYAFIVSCICGCVNNSPEVVRGVFLSVTDPKPNTDSIYTERIIGYNIISRYIELCFTIHNNTEKKMYLPLKTWSDSIAESSVNVYFTDGNDTIFPNYVVRKNPYNSNYISKGDSLLLYIKVLNFEKWSNSRIDVNTDLDTLINRLHVEYRKSPDDEQKDYVIPDVEFDKWPQFYYEIPQDQSVLRKSKKRSDRLLVRTR